MRSLFHIPVLFFLLICVGSSQLPSVSSLLFKRMELNGCDVADAENEEADTEEEKEQEGKEDLKEKLPKWFEQSDVLLPFFDTCAPLYPVLNMNVRECFAELLTPPPRLV